MREDLAARKAIELIAERAQPISVAQAQAREQLWTPEQANEPESAGRRRGAGGRKLWTPTDRGAGS